MSDVVVTLLSGTTVTESKLSAECCELFDRALRRRHQVLDLRARAAQIQLEAATLEREVSRLLGELHKRLS